MKPTKVVGVSSFIEQGRNTFLATRFCAQLGAHGLQAFGIRMERPDAGLLYDYLQLKACRKVTSTRGPKASTHSRAAVSVSMSTLSLQCYGICTWLWRHKTSAEAASGAEASSS